MSEWREVKLGDVCEIIKRGITPKYVNNNGIRVINQKCIRDYQINFDLCKHTDINKKYTQEKFLKDLDILINSTGIGTVGRVAQLKKVKEKSLCDSHVMIVRPNELVIAGFLGYVLKNRQKEIEKLAEGSTGQVELSAKRLSSLNIFLPPLPIQKKIADILSVIDEKIETLQNINETLEEMAKAIFKSWFVDFDIVKAKEEGKSDSEIAKEFGISEKIVKLFPGEFIESEIGKIPKGWTVGSFEQDCNIVYGKNLPKSKLKEKGYPVFGGNGIIGYYDKFLYEEPQVIIACRGAASGKVNITLPYSFVTNNSLIIEIKNESLCFEYIKYLSVFTDFTTYVTGSAQPQITITNIKKHKFLLPPEIVMEEYSKIVCTPNLLS